MFKDTQLRNINFLFNICSNSSITLVLNGSTDILKILFTECL